MTPFVLEQLWTKVRQITESSKTGPRPALRTCDVPNWWPNRDSVHGRVGWERMLQVEAFNNTHQYADGVITSFHNFDPVSVIWPLRKLPQSLLFNTIIFLRCIQITGVGPNCVAIMTPDMDREYR